MLRSVLINKLSIKSRLLETIDYELVLLLLDNQIKLIEQIIPKLGIYVKTVNS